MLAVYGIKSWEYENQDMKNNLAIQAGFAAKTSQAVFDNIGAGMEMLGKLLSKQDIIANPESARPALMEYKAKHPEIAAMALISPNGQMLLNTAALPGEPLPDLHQYPEYFRSFRFDLNNTYSYNIGLNQDDMGLHRWHFPFRHTVVDSGDNPLLVIQAAIPIEIADLLWSDLSLLPGSRVGLIRADGYLQLAWPVSDASRTYGKPQTGALIQTIRTNPGKITGNFEGISDIDGTARIGEYSHLLNANMSAFVSVPRPLILSRWWEHNYPILLFFIGYLAMISIITYRLIVREKQHTRELLVQSRKDHLTGLPNRIAIDELITREIARARRTGKPVALLYLDVDKFKDVNDSFGHAIGDRLLNIIALRMQAILRDEDVLCRPGGDEFLIILSNSSAEKAGSVALRMISAFKSTMTPTI